MPTLWVKVTTAELAITEAWVENVQGYSHIWMRMERIFDWQVLLANDHGNGVLTTLTDKNTQQGLMMQGIEPVAISIIIPMRRNFHV